MTKIYPLLPELSINWTCSRFLLDLFPFPSSGVKGGFKYGATDENGYYAVENKMHVHDLHATLLHLMGIDHLRLTHRHAGRDFRLTDVAGKVHSGILA